MNILYCGDGNIADGVILSVLSLCRAVKEPLHIYILTATVSHKSTCRKALEPRFADFLQEQIKTYHPDHTVTLFDITELFSDDKPTANMDTRFTPCCMLRLYADLVEELPDKILYLDNDVICRLAPSTFYYQDMGNASIAGVLDNYGRHFFKKNLFVSDYLNSGVLLLNLKRIRQNGLFRNCRNKCKNEEMFMPDQSAINKLCDNKIICHRKYNEQKKLRKDTVFQHFTTRFRFFPIFHTVSVKPWNIEGMHKTLHLYAYDSLLAEYERINAFYKKENKSYERDTRILFHR
ncbi:MAG: glycosyltransferase family 8 protein [Clostridia bacterium]|nr:glycosyltransferase family 8 protein [Clostridia bacterium]